MSDVLKTKISTLEHEMESIDYGDAFINDVFKKLDSETKKKVIKYQDKEMQKNLLKDMSDIKIKTFYDELDYKLKEKIDELPLRDRYRQLKKMMETKNEDKSKIKNLHYLINKSSNQQGNQQSSNVKESVQETPRSLSNETPRELFQEEPSEIIEKKEKQTNESPQHKFNNLMKTFYNLNPFVKYSSTTNYELEVKFGTKGIKHFTKNDYDNVIKKMKSCGFTTNDTHGVYYLRVNCEFLDSVSGKFKMSDIRTEIEGLHNIQDYCKHNDIKLIQTKNPLSLKFLNKKPAFIDKQKIYPVDFNDFNFRVTMSSEESIKTGIKNFIINNWKTSKKIFRYINRVTFQHDDYPVLVDISIVKYSNRGPDNFGNPGRGEMLRVYNTTESNVFENQEVYEIEIEVDNNKIGPGTLFNTPEKIIESVRKVIKFVLGGLQGTNYPISYPEQKHILNSYMSLIWKDEFNENKRITGQNFIGPNSITLQITNVAQLDENTNKPNIRKDFVVTEKADGNRHLLYVSNEGKIYLINTNMDIIFTGAKTQNEDCYNVLIDGELILHDKNGKFINLFAAFDIYYAKKIDLRHLSFMLLNEEKDINKSRYHILKHIIKTLNPVSIVVEPKHSLIGSPIRITCKDFYPRSNKETIFNGCDEILRKEREGRFDYNTDGLIFTHAFYGVGSNVIGKSGPKTKITWENSFKWKPPKFNTIDFLVTTIKDVNGDDVIKPIFNAGISTEFATQLTEYKQIELRCGFSESKDGFINPCQDVIDDKLPQFIERFESKQTNDYLPKRFYPTDPYDPKTGLAKIMLKMDSSGTKRMFTEEGDIFADNTIVEFSYNFENESGWRWVPLRVRYDKTSRYLKGEKEYGNSYKTCNENWKSIHNPITEDMICTGLNIPDLSVSEDVYYNTPTGDMLTEPMKNFHNLYVKKLLIKNVSKQGDTLIDYACGKAGDLPKWIASRLSFVFGIDLSADNLENRINGACARFLNAKRDNKNMPYALFVNGNSANNIKNGNAMLNDKAVQITKAVFGIGPKDPEKIGKGVSRNYGIGEEGFNISSCQFATHYFFETPSTLQGFVRNLAECTKLNGYFIGTAYDGKLVFNMLKKVKTGESVVINENGKKIWEVTKGYGADTFEDNSSSIGYRIDVFQESINQSIPEYLINFDYFNRVLYAYGFKLIERDEAKDLGLPEGSGLFSELFMNMLEEIKINKFKEKDYKNAANMKSYEKKISFLNRYFVYKKIMEVNAEKVELELSEYSESEVRLNVKETSKAIQVAKAVNEENAAIKPKIRKLSKKLLLIAATEAVDENNPVIIEKVRKIKSKTTNVKKEQPVKKMLIIEDDDDDDEK